MIPRRLLHRLFEYALVLKAALAGFEGAMGLALLTLPHQRLVDMAGPLLRSSLLVPHHDPLAQRLRMALADFSGPVQHFYALFLMAHGLAKLVIVLLLMKGYRFAYPLGIAVFGGFIALQMHRWASTGSSALLALSAMDCVVIWLTWREWQAGPRKA